MAIVNPVIKLRRDVAAAWVTDNPVLAEGEPGYEKDTHLLKIGNGLSRWNDLPYFAPQTPVNPDGGGPVSDVALMAHIASLTPHPVYDDGPSLLLLYENAKV